MKPNSRLVLSTIVVIVFLCFTFIFLKPTRVAHWKRDSKREAASQIKPTSVDHREKVKKEEAVRQIIDYMQGENVELEDEQSRAIAEMVYDESRRCNVDYRLVLALMKIESNFRYDAVSEQGARGLLQVKPSLAKYVAEDIGITWRGSKTLDEPDKNIKIGVHFFSQLIEDFQSVNMALHAYHVGPTKLRELLGKKKKPHKDYLNLVLDEYDRNRSVLPPP